MPPSVLMAGVALFLSILLYALFVARFVAHQEGMLTCVAAWHVPLAVVATLLSLYGAVRHRSNLGLALFACSALAIMSYMLFTAS